ncbi:hypothetical protein BDV27DRAFT_145818 [Aspergillus caelatus]|uniref:Alcohol dehydrogenase-like N-terminal domain-containing protein n=1 Tax=Aspergillus caelatus TaxID=61420 RepID=A0A5N7A1X4_9EURO|nr:uncharacterized protein BDV27DRAFT_145818 [Aspergillus caelatus]KAE8363822.1 hypothetical protein BDV27DRAFT_145818 [Aspergillus caelatus]
MQAIRVHPAPTTAMHLDNIPIPKPSQPGELLVRVKAITIVRDMLTWPETYSHEYVTLGSDVAGTVAEVFSSDSKFKPSDQVFGMADIDRAAIWALFDHARIPRPTMKGIKSRATRKQEQRVLITGAAGAVGVYLVQLAAAAAGVTVVAATSSNARNGEFLQCLGACGVVEYGMLGCYRGTFDVIIDVVGGELLVKCWDYVTETGMLISIDSASFNFVEEHEKRGLRKSGVCALFFIVKGSADALHYLAELVGVGAV